MANLLRTGAAWLAGVMATHMATTIVYRRGAVTKEIEATVGKTDYPTIDASGVEVIAVTRDYLFAADALEELGKPENGDVITEVISTANGDKTLTCQVNDLPGERCYRHSDEGRQIVRVFTKVVREQ